MGHYQANIRDIEFNIFETLGLTSLFDSGVYGDLDAAAVRDILREIEKVACGPVAQSFVSADRDPVTFDPATHSISVPQPLRNSLAALRETEWHLVGKPAEMGGIPAPNVLVFALEEMVRTANPALIAFDMGADMSMLLYTLGTARQRHWAIGGLHRHWQATMALTEPEAGSDVGAGRTRATPQSDGSWHIEGVKRFISGGDLGDTTENIFHMVLARPVGAESGVKGLSLFYVPKYLFDPETLEIRERNGVYVTGIEHKMGMKSSPTCELTFGGDKPAVGWLVGEAHAGISQMFRVLSYARMVVGVKATGTLSAGYLQALAYAKQRVQGADLTRFTEKDAPRVPIVKHPEVRRSLAMQKAYAEGLRALYLYTAAHQNSETAAVVSGAEPDMAARIADLLLPVVKGVASERAFALLAESLQVFGGSGYLQDHPIEQYLRDTKVDSVYEGTTAIQAQDFLFRKTARDGGTTFGFLMGQVEQFLDGTGDSRLSGERKLLAAGLDDVHGMLRTLTEYFVAAGEQPNQLYKIGLVSVRFLLAVGDLLVGWLLLRQAEVAVAALESDPVRDRDFYRGKIGVASFFAKNVLPMLGATREIIAAVDTEVMDLPEAVF